MKTLKTILISLLVIWYSEVKCQPGDKIASLRIAIYSEELNLTPDEARVFWPLFNEYQQKQKEIKKQANELKIKYSKNQNISNAEALEAINKFLEFEQKELDLKKEYMNKIARVIPPQKAMRINKAEQRFKKALLERIKDWKDD